MQYNMHSIGLFYNGIISLNRLVCSSMTMETMGQYAVDYCYRYVCGIGLHLSKGKLVDAEFAASENDKPPKTLAVECRVDHQLRLKSRS